MVNIDKAELRKQLQYELARRSFWEFCKLMDPSFYKESRTYLKEICETLQRFYESDDLILVLNMGPRLGKSYTLQHFTLWIFGKNPKEKIMTGSYNETLSTVFAKAVRNKIQEEKVDADITVYNDIFPDVHIKEGDAAMNLWSLRGQYNSYLATSPKGGSTGFGTSLLLLDDVVRNAEEAYNDNVLENLWLWFTNTLLSRLEEGGKIICLMTRWNTLDVAGRILQHFPSIGRNVVHINFPAVNPDGSTICEELLSRESCEMKRKTIGEDIFMANYQQEPLDVQGRLYEHILTYDDVPRDVGDTPLFAGRRAYVDTADTGSDFLACVCFGVSDDKKLYILDTLCTKEPMEKTEDMVAKMLHENDIRVADIESNNGGRGFARNVDRILKEKYNNHTCVIKWFTQSHNKKARILSNSANVMNSVLFPKDWTIRWPEFAKQLLSYQKEGKNAHDDVPDCVTGAVEKTIVKPPIKINPLILRTSRVFG